MLNVIIVSTPLAVCKLENIPTASPTPHTNFWSLTQTDDEISLVCDQNLVPDNAKVESGWRAIKILGELDFSEIGILSRLSQALAEHSVSIFVISTFNTDYILVRQKQLDAALEILQAKNLVRIGIR